MPSTKTFTRTFVRTAFLRAELAGFVGGTIRIPVVQRVVKYGCENKVLKNLEIFLHDSSRVRAQAIVSVDWDKHEMFLKKSSDTFPEFDSESQDKVNSEVFKVLIEIMTEFKAEKKLTYGWNVEWTSDGTTHDKACDLNRSPRSLLAARSGAQSNKYAHELLQEASVFFTIDTDDD